MKKLIFFFVLSTVSYSLSAQGSDTKDQLTVWSEQAWIMKALNTGSVAVTFKFSWTTIGTNSEGEVISTLVEESQRLTINPNETRHLFTAPQDPNKQITYVFKDIIITEYKIMTMQELMKEKINAKKKSGQ